MQHTHTSLESRAMESITGQLQKKKSVGRRQCKLLSAQAFTQAAKAILYEDCQPSD
jgi:hypothetical protein